MSDPVRLGDCLPDFLSDLRKHCGLTPETGGVCETMDGHSEAGSASTEHRPLATISSDRKGREGHHA